ncbi:hypothetical protein M0C34_12635 [Agarivorans sp. TSD2052]|uniref:hypothetical protein n=1 Tax=Agarivorans sp. TSD2052 TaxID=2937286 RepID=UPI00200F3B65|nr:hypothetical protein [Agarivorans sp. TSD2052]UPW17095.1 hypothetical protein M0C34_12635 [Agarivorans sp. TSD2052]
MKSLRNYQPEIFGVIVGLAILNIWYLSSVAIEESVVPKSYDYVIRAFTVAVGGFIGAFSAFRLKKHEEYKIDKNKQKSALNSALFVLIRQINAIQCVTRDFDKYKTSFDRGFSLPAMKPPDYSAVKQDVVNLNFLVEKDKAQMLMDLTIEQERFEQAISAIGIRNEFYVNEVQPALSFHDLNGKPLLWSEFEEKLGERLFQGSINGAETMYGLVYASEKSLQDKYTDLRKLAKELFPNEKFLKWVKM